jgi:hypothetical protein
MPSETIVPNVKSKPKPTATIWARMKPLLLSLFILHLSLLTIQSCGLDVEDPTPPSPPVWVQKSLPEEWPERGIDAHESGGIYLEWDSSPNENVTSYKIFRAEYFEVADSLSDMALLKVLDQTSGSKLEYLDFGVPVGKVLCYSMVAVDQSLNQSYPSDSICFSLHRPITSDMMVPNGQSDTLSISRTLNWQNYYLDDTEDYCVTILTEYGDYIYRRILQPQSYVGGSEKWDIPTDIVLEVGQNYQWRIDTGGRYNDGLETSGSESAWAAFLFTGE